jgi:hypothetical protein
VLERELLADVAEVSPGVDGHVANLGAGACRITTELRRICCDATSERTRAG